MAINKNHEFEELEGVKCGIVEKNATPARVEFLKRLLTYNGFTVVTAAPVFASTPRQLPSSPTVIQALDALSNQCISRAAISPWNAPGSRCASSRRRTQSARVRMGLNSAVFCVTEGAVMTTLVRTRRAATHLLRQRERQRRGSKTSCRGAMDTAAHRRRNRSSFTPACGPRRAFLKKIPGAGIEPARPCGHEILSLERLPVSPSG